MEATQRTQGALREQIRQWQQKEAGNKGELTPELWQARIAESRLARVLAASSSIELLLAWAPTAMKRLAAEFVQEERVAILALEGDTAELLVLHTQDKAYQVSVRDTSGRMSGIKTRCECQRMAAICVHQVAALTVLHGVARGTAQLVAVDAAPVDVAQPAQPAAPPPVRFRLPSPPPLTPPPPTWDQRLAAMLETTTGSRKAARMILAFSLQTQGSGWHLVPYAVPATEVSAAQLTDRVALGQALSHAGIIRHARRLLGYQQSTLTHYHFATPELAGLARMCANSYYTMDAVFLTIALPALANGLLFRGTPEHPFKHPMIVQPDVVTVGVVLEPVAEGHQLVPALLGDEAPVSLRNADAGVISVDPPWLFVGDRLWRAEGDLSFIRHLLNEEALTIPDSERELFLLEHLPALAARVPVEGGFLGRRELVTLPVRKRLYLTEEDGTLVATLAFGYGDYEVGYNAAYPETSVCHDPARATLVTIQRQPEAEGAAWAELSTFGLKRDGYRHVLRQRVAPVDFLVGQVPKLQRAGYDLFGEDALTGARLRRVTPKVSLRVASGIDWFEVVASVAFDEQSVSLATIRKAIRRREGFVKLPDGTLGVIPEEWLARFGRLFSLGEETEEGIRLSKTQALLLELALAEGDEVQADAEYTRRIAALRDFTQIAPQPTPATFVGELRPYQHAGYEWLHFLHAYEFGGCLADDMGLGKTVQALAFLQSLKASGHATTASLIVMPRSLLENWAREAARFTPDLRVRIHADGMRGQEIAAFAEVDLVLTTYGVMLRDLELFRQYRFHYLVLDEAQAMKNAQSQTARAARMLKGEHCLALTGTPVENTAEELWSLFAFLNPGQLGSQDAFRSHFVGPIQRDGSEEAATALRALVHPFILRRTKDQVAPELPPRTERILTCEMEPAQRRLYDRTRDGYRAELLGLIDREGMQEARFKVLEALLRLRQLANDPRLVHKEHVGTSAKVDTLLETLEVLRAEGHKALVFSQFTSMLALVREALDARDWPYLYLDGKTKERQALVDRFQADPAIPLFLISLKAGGTGLNLTAADYVIHLDPWWNPAVERQASDRTHRIGQERPVMVIKLIVPDTVEAKILTLQEKKQALVESLITTERSAVKSLTRDDVAALLG
jgi:non-specific serine/threonine protein kinase